MMEDKSKQPENNRRSYVYNPKDKSFYCHQDERTYYLGEEHSYDEKERIIYDKNNFIWKLNENNFLWLMYFCQFCTIMAELKKKEFDIDFLSSLVEYDIPCFLRPKDLDTINSELTKFLEQKPFDFPYLMRYVFDSTDRLLDKLKMVNNKSKTRTATLGKILKKEQKLNLKENRLVSTRERLLPPEERMCLEGELLSGNEIYEKIYELEQKSEYKGGADSPGCKIYRKIENPKYGYSTFRRYYSKWKAKKHGDKGTLPKSLILPITL